jgi:hypothetical protein
MDERGTPTQQFDTMLSSHDPIHGILMLLLNRERERQRLHLSAEAQLELLEALAFECGQSFILDDLRLYASTLFGLEEPTQLTALESHALLIRGGDRFIFRFDFVYLYLTARALINQMSKDASTRDVLRMLAELRSGSSLLERAVEYLHASCTRTGLGILANAWPSVRDNATSPAQSGFFQLVLAAAQRENAGGPRFMITETIQNTLGLAKGGLQKLHFEGVLSGLDLRNVTFESCTFKSVDFTKCVFDQTTTFRQCIFADELRFQDCTGVDKANISREDNTIAAGIRETLRIEQGDSLDTEEIRKALRLALHKFYDGSGFNIVNRKNLNRGMLARSPICNDVWEALQRFRVVVPHVAAGVADNSLCLDFAAKGEVRMFLNNAVLMGRLRKTAEALA